MYNKLIEHTKELTFELEIYDVTTTCIQDVSGSNGLCDLLFE